MQSEVGSLHAMAELTQLNQLSFTNPVHKGSTRPRHLPTRTLAGFYGPGQVVRDVLYMPIALSQSVKAATFRVGRSCTAVRAAVMTAIGTHSGTFHCDEALGCFLLKQTAQFKHAEIVRSREPTVLDKLDIVIDVGGVYEPEKQRYDHHQRGFTESFGQGFTTKLSSAGLVYKHYGRQIIASIMGKPEEAAEVEAVYLRVYQVFMEAIDGIDNGVNQWDSPEPPKYVDNTHLSARVGSLNPRWNEDFGDAALYERFLRAVQLTGAEFLETVDYVAHAWLPGRAIVEQCLQQRHSVHSSGAVFQLTQYCPWKEHLYELERQHGIEGEIKFCLYQDERQNWRIQAVSVTPGSFQNRLSLPAAWQGLRDNELSKVSGIPECIFVHASGFIGANKTYEGVRTMAAEALLQTADGRPTAKKQKA